MFVLSLCDHPTVPGSHPPTIECSAPGICIIMIASSMYDGKTVTVHALEDGNGVVQIDRKGFVTLQ